MKNKNLVMGLLIISFLFTNFIMLDRGSFEEIILSKLENYEFIILDITYSETVKYSRDNSEIICELLDYLKTLELEEVAFSQDSNNEPYHIRITGYEGLTRGSLFVEVNSQRYIDVYIVTKDSNKNSIILSKHYKITNADFDYNLLNNIMDTMPQPK
jgi:hypothetical protein